MCVHVKGAAQATFQPSSLVHFSSVRATCKWYAYYRQAFPLVIYHYRVGIARPHKLGKKGDIINMIQCSPTMESSQKAKETMEDL